MTLSPASLRSPEGGMLPFRDSVLWGEKARLSVKISLKGWSGVSGEIEASGDLLITGGFQRSKVLWLYYAIMKAYESMPRLYSTGTGTEDWKTRLAENLTNAVVKEVERGRFSVSGVDVTREFPRFRVTTSFTGTSVRHTVEIPDPVVAEVEQRTRDLPPQSRMVVMDSFLMEGVKRQRAFFIPAVRSGIMYLMRNILVYQVENLPRLPGLPAPVFDFLKAMIVSPNYSMRLPMGEVKVRALPNTGEMFFEGEAFHTAPAEVLSLFPLAFLLREVVHDGDMVMVEDVDAHLSQESLDFIRRSMEEKRGRVNFVVTSSSALNWEGWDSYSIEGGTVRRRG